MFELDIEWHQSLKDKLRVSSDWDQKNIFIKSNSFLINRQKKDELQIIS